MQDSQITETVEGASSRAAHGYTPSNYIGASDAEKAGSGGSGRSPRLRVLIACECSGAVRDAFAALGHDAMSCDMKPDESETQGKHYQGDARDVMADGWDMMIAHPPCTHLACSGAAWFAAKRADGRQQQGIELFMAFTAAPIRRICIENPVGIMSRVWREPDQIIQPYYFGDEYQKTTCLWLKNLPPLQHAAEDDWFATKTHVGKGEMVRYESGKVMPKWYADARGNGALRSKTFPGIAQAMALQWGGGGAEQAGDGNGDSNTRAQGYNIEAHAQSPRP